MTAEYLKRLNPEQLQAALCKTHCLVVAAPGSGKTGMLAAKAANLLSDGVTRVAAVTFTRDSAIELRHRILSLAGEAVMPRMLVGTFHSLDLLMAFPMKRKSLMGGDILSEMCSPFTKQWVLVSNGDRINHILRAMKEAKLEVSKEYSHRNASKTIETFKATGVMPQDPQEARMVEFYADMMNRHGVIDFQDILLLTNAALKDGTMTPLAVDYLLLDEFQDTDQTQLDWAFAHGVRSKLTAVGDDDQSIYGFRSALGYAGMTNFETHFRAEKIVLGTNYRSRAEILAAAGKVIIVNTIGGRQDKVLFSAKGPGGLITWDRFVDPQAEGEACVDFIKKAILEVANVAVIARTNRKLDLIEARLFAQGIPFKRADGESILDSHEFALFNATLTCIKAPTAAAIDLLLGWAGVSDEDTREIHSKFGKEIKKKKLAEYKDTSLTPEGRKVWQTFAKAINEWKTTVIPKNMIYLLVTGISDWLNSYAPDNRSKGKFKMIGDMYMPTDYHTFFERIDYIEKTRKDKGKNPAEGVELPKTFLLTAHGSKGLEYDRVWVIGAESDAFPDPKSQEAEERRLFYVAMTRAREQLVISSSGAAVHSKFIDESMITRAEINHFRQPTTN